MARAGCDWLSQHKALGSWWYGGTCSRKGATFMMVEWRALPYRERGGLIVALRRPPCPQCGVRHYGDMCPVVCVECGSILERAGPFFLQETPLDPKMMVCECDRCKVCGILPRGIRSTGEPWGCMCVDKFRAPGVFRSVLDAFKALVCGVPVRPRRRSAAEPQPKSRWRPTEEDIERLKAESRERRERQGEMDCRGGSSVQQSK